MEPRNIDAFGAASLVGFSTVLALNQVVIKVVNDGLQPVFSAGLRSAGAALVLFLVFRLARRPLSVPRAAWPGLLFVGIAFSVEFIFLFVALDLTTVVRASVIFYSMPVWMAVGAHFLLPGDRLTPLRGLGLALAMGGVAWAILNRPAGGEASLAGDLCALAAAVFWAAIGLGVRGTRAREASPQVQLMMQLLMSMVVLLAASAFFGPLVRDPGPLTWAGMTFQIFVVASAGYLFWLWLLTRYKASSVASFSFLSPVFGVIFGWLLLNETLGQEIFGSLLLVAAGLILINRRPKAA